MKAGADGFRLDVVDELPDEFIARLRKKMKSVIPDALLIGEVWEDASNKISYGVRRLYFVSGELDSVMNYPFRNAIIALVNERDASTFRNTVMTIAENYPKDALLCVMNILSTHDTARILTVLNGVTPMSKEDRAVFRMSGPEKELAIKKLRAAMFIQFILPGIPSTFYGDEIATEGYEDPFCRTFFDWKRVPENEILFFFRNLALFRKESDILRRGDIAVSLIGDSAVKITRSLGDKMLHAIINAGHLPIVYKTVSDPLIFENTSADCGNLTVGEYGFALI